ncbi:hypothetical protein [Flavonifractor hominis]|uniref:Uncharacterized protein n=1 Tax=Flavonifractor hominis TaxID=3133178 RepID=A0ABV1ERI9_9FIRM
MKQIITKGITYLEPLAGSSEWYWGMDYTGGDLYEAGDLYRDKHPIQRNRGILIRYPEGSVYEPVHTQPGQYLGKPVYCDGKVALLMVDFPKEKIHILTFDGTTGKADPLAVLPLALAGDCYNLMLKTSPLLLTRAPQGNRFYILWPERREFVLEDCESFVLLDGDRMYTEKWYEDPDYRDEVLVRDVKTGKVLERMPGSVWPMPDGQKWLLV